MTVRTDKRTESPLQEWRIWPFLTACTGTQLAYAILHIVANDFFACVLSMFSFIGSLCCIISRRFEVVLANLLLQAVAFLTLFVCCCLGTSSMKIWHDDKKLVPIIVTHIVFFAAVLILSGFLLILKRRQRCHKAEKGTSAGENWRTPFGGRTESTFATYPKTPISSGNFSRLQQDAKERQAPPEQATSQQNYSCPREASPGVEQSCRYGSSHTNTFPGRVGEGPPSAHANVPSSSTHVSPDASYKDESEDGEVTHVVTMGRSAPSRVCERSAGSPHLVIRSQQIESAASAQHYSVPETHATSRALAIRLCRRSDSSATPVLHQTSCISHGTALTPVSPGDLASGRRRRISPRVDNPPAPWVPPPESSAATGRIGVFVAHHGSQEKATHMPTSPGLTTPRRCRKCQIYAKSATCPRSSQALGPCSCSSASSLRRCVTVGDEEGECGTITPSRNDESCPPASTGSRKYRSANAISKSIRRCWETTLNYLSQAVDSGAAAEPSKEKSLKLHQGVATTSIIPSSITARDAATSAEHHLQEELLQGTCSSRGSVCCDRRSSVDNPRSDAHVVCGAQSPPTESKDNRRNSTLEDKDAETTQQSISGLSRERGLVIEAPFLPEAQTPIKEWQAGAVLVETMPPPLKLVKRNLAEDSWAPVRTKQGSKASTEETPQKGAEGQDEGAHLSPAESYTEPEQHITDGHAGDPMEQSEYGKGSAKPTMAPAAAEISVKPLDSRSEGGELPCPLFEMTPTAKHENNETTLPSCGAVFDSVNGTTGHPRVAGVPEHGLEQQTGACSAQSLSIKDSTSPGENRSVVALVNPPDDHFLPELESDGGHCVTSQHIGNRSPTYDHTGDHSSLEREVVRCANSAWKGSTAPLKIGDTLPLVDRLPSSGVAVMKADQTGVSLHDTQAETVKCQLADSKTPMTGCTQYLNSTGFPEAVGKVREPSLSATTAVTVGGQNLPCSEGEKGYGIKNMLDDGEAQHSQGSNQPDLPVNQRVPAARLRAEPSGKEARNESSVCRIENSKDALEAVATRGVLVSRPSSTTVEHVETGTGSEAPLVQTGLHCLDVPAVEKASSAGGTELAGYSTCGGRSTKEVQHPVDRTVLSLSTAAPATATNTPVISVTKTAVGTDGRPPSYGGIVSKEKIVYMENLTRELTSNTSPRADDEEDSWEDESDETGSQLEDGILSRRRSEKESRSEWELSDVSDAGAPLAQRRHGKALQKSLGSHYKTSAESVAASGKHSAGTRDRAYRRRR